ncbi:hypothetical protein cyc_00896 [Cyclospora cayetanensis]|uniref:Uncharacterized protein n=1 Tax=Cyclospora cayetanensis TaxID=88456 RepID=A0A1D3D2J5_9EIME|nr:hypothetical protein cyc_00896 [Cyclospora cayetanensis]
MKDTQSSTSLADDRQQKVPCCTAPQAAHHLTRKTVDIMIICRETRTLVLNRTLGELLASAIHGAKQI